MPSVDWRQTVTIRGKNALAMIPAAEKSATCGVGAGKPGIRPPFPATAAVRPGPPTAPPARRPPSPTSGILGT